MLGSSSSLPDSSNKHSKSASPSSDSPVSADKEKTKRSKSSSKEKGESAKPERNSSGGKKVGSTGPVLDPCRTQHSETQSVPSLGGAIVSPHSFDPLRAVVEQLKRCSCNGLGPAMT